MDSIQSLCHLNTSKIDGYYYCFLRRVVDVKAAYISRVSNIKIWEMANKPITAAQLVLKQQTEILLEVLATPPEDPYHHIIFSSAYRDRISEILKTTTERPNQHWLRNILSILQEPTNLFFPITPQYKTQCDSNNYLTHHTSTASWWRRQRALQFFLWPLAISAQGGRKKKKVGVKPLAARLASRPQKMIRWFTLGPACRRAAAFFNPLAGMMETGSSYIAKKNPMYTVCMHLTGSCLG